MVAEMKVADEEAQELRLKKQLEGEIRTQEFKKQQRRAFMPMYKEMPDFVLKNHHNPTFGKDKHPRKGITPDGTRFL